MVTTKKGPRADFSPLPELYKEQDPWYQQRTFPPIHLPGKCRQIWSLLVLVSPIFDNPEFYSAVYSRYLRVFPDGSVVKNLPPKQEMGVWSLGGEDPLQKEMATCSIIFALPRKFHGQRSLAGYSLWGHRRVGHNWATKQKQQQEFLIETPPSSSDLVIHKYNNTRD